MVTDSISPFSVCLHMVNQRRSDPDCVDSALQQLPPAITMAAAREEAELVIFESVEKTLKKANIRPNQASRVDHQHVPFCDMSHNV